MREKRLYGLFEKQGEKLVRIYPGQAYRLSVARKAWQNSLTAYALGGLAVQGPRELRPVKDYGFCHE